MAFLLFLKHSRHAVHSGHFVLDVCSSWNAIPPGTVSSLQLTSSLPFKSPLKCNLSFQVLLFFPTQFVSIALNHHLITTYSWPWSNWVWTARTHLHAKVFSWPTQFKPMFTDQLHGWESTYVRGWLWLSIFDFWDVTTPNPHIAQRVTMFYFIFFPYLLYSP